MKISVLIAAYHAEPYISRALEAVRTQRHSDWEVIVVEDGSRDGTESIVETFAASVSQPVRYKNLGQNQGVAVTRSRLLDLAEGEGMAFLDADDWWDDGHLESLDALLHGGADVAIAGIELFDLETGCAFKTHFPPERLIKEPVQALFAESCIMTSSSVGLTRAIADKVGAFDAAFRIGEDRDYWLRCALAGGRFAISRQTTCHYAKHAKSTMGKTILWVQQEVAFYRKHQALPEIAPPIRRDLCSKIMVNAARVLRASNPRESVALLWQAWKLTPCRLLIVSQWLFSLAKAARDPNSSRNHQ
jgi:glycosyltransferase involved in cell wall biosynthesis